MSFLHICIEVEGFDQLLCEISRIAEALETIAANQPTPAPPGPSITGGKFVIIVQDTQTPVTYAITGVSAVDAKGQPVADAALTYLVESTDPSVVAITADPTDQTKGSASFGNEGPATVEVTISLTSDGTVLGSFAQSFTVTAGPVTAIAGGTISFAGLTDVP